MSEGYQPKRKALAGEPIPPESGSAIVRPVADRVVQSEPDKIWITIGRKTRLGQYESLELDIGVSVMKEPGETIKAAIKRVSAELRTEHLELLEILREDQNV